MPPSIIWVTRCICHPVSLLINWLHTKHFPSCFSQSLRSFGSHISFRVWVHLCSKYGSHFGSYGFASALILTCRRILVSAALISVAHTGDPSGRVAPIFPLNIQFLDPCGLKYFLLIHKRLLFGCLRLHHCHIERQIWSSTLLKVFEATTCLW